MKKSCIIIVLVTLLDGAGWAQQNNMLLGYWLHDCSLAYAGRNEQTSGDREKIERAMKIGWLLGFVSGVESWGIVFQEATPHSPFTIPDNVKVDQICVVIGDYLDKHSEQWSAPSFVIASLALSEVWPYQARGTK